MVPFRPTGPAEQGHRDGGVAAWRFERRKMGNRGRFCRFCGLGPPGSGSCPEGTAGQDRHTGDDFGRVRAGAIRSGMGRGGNIAHSLGGRKVKWTVFTGFACFGVMHIFSFPQAVLWERISWLGFLWNFNCIPCGSIFCLFWPSPRPSF
ncbi:hypothetical protein WN944_020973 [Citrus x changshan-huyou]|uniref:Uncharacterized protein n=1 Tax=Citrus x changshan-huyou TaxID=2935761 RepID=A0AAP0MYD4_9ROSI